LATHWLYAPISPCRSVGERYRRGGGQMAADCGAMMTRETKNTRTGENSPAAVIARL
jgi:hypothetical protein